ncbi:uncharacterized protein LOC129772854 [Toxorhynchites rutilus septentrionalis]|uniref:uncharacterized protein LOC129772854 n=1 Tax=Toxorhynchites rutilus septentrionalis TaxID=329112 RepID=UPI00247B1AD7|nr:uncharacterized protein LOC129772854 [Toxorhynchites rutilus septentrionalis]
MSRGLETKPITMMRKKFFRYVLKGAHFFIKTRKQKRFTLPDLVSYVYLKNQRMDRLEFVESMVKLAVERYKRLDLLAETPRGKFHLKPKISHSNIAPPLEPFQITDVEASEEEIQAEESPIQINNVTSEEEIPPEASTSQSLGNEALRYSKDDKNIVIPPQRKCWFCNIM